MDHKIANSTANPNTCSVQSRADSDCLIVNKTVILLGILGELDVTLRTNTCSLLFYGYRFPKNISEYCFS